MSNCHAKWLRAMVAPMRAEGHTAWANTCEQAADEIERLDRHEHAPEPKCICKPPESGPNWGMVHTADWRCPIHGGLMQNAVPQRGAKPPCPVSMPGGDGLDCTCESSPQRGVDTRPGPRVQCPHCDDTHHIDQLVCSSPQKGPT